MNPGRTQRTLNALCPRTASFLYALSVGATTLALGSAALAQPAPAQPQAPAPAQPAPGAARPPAAQPGAAQPGAAQPAAAAQPDAADPGEEAESTLKLREAPELDEPLKEALKPRPGGLTANEVARRAEVSSHSLVVKRAEIDAAAAKVDQAVATFLPRLTLSATYTRLSNVDNSLAGGGGGGLLATNSDQVEVGPCPAGTTIPGATGCVLNAVPVAVDFPSINNNYSLKANLTVPFSDYLLRLSSSIATTRHEKRAAELTAAAERRKIRADARVAFYNWTRGIGQLTVSEKSLERVKARLNDVKVAFELGSATKADVLRLEALVASTEAGIESVRAFRALSAQQLSTIMKDSRSQYELGESVTTPVAPLPPGRTLDACIREAYSRRLELQALGEASHALRESVTVMERGRLPRLDGFAEYDFANPNQRIFPSREEWNGTWMAGLRLSWTVNDMFINDAIAHELRAKRDGVEAQARALRDGVRMEVVSAYLDGRKARAALAAAQRGAEAAQEAYSVATELYRVGRATTTELIGAESELVGALLQLVNAMIDERVARTKLAYATGEDMTKVR